MTWKTLKVFGIDSVTYSTNEKGLVRIGCCLCKKSLKEFPYFKLIVPYKLFCKSCWIKYVKELLRKSEVIEQVFVLEDL